MTTATRSEELPDIPTVGDFVPGYEVSTWYGMGAPRTRLPRSSRAQQGDQCGPCRPQAENATCRLGGTVLPGSPADFGKLTADEIEKWGKVIRAANIKPQ